MKAGILCVLGLEQYLARISIYKYLLTEEQTIQRQNISSFLKQKHDTLHCKITVLGCPWSTAVDPRVPQESPPGCSTVWGRLGEGGGCAEHLTSTIGSAAN